MRIHTALMMSIVLLFATAAPAFAWKGEPTRARYSIAEVNERAEEGDYARSRGISRTLIRAPARAPS
jgi:hypothetical protein